MTNANSRRWIMGAAAIVVVFAATGVAAMHLAVQLLKTSVEHALGPEIRFDRLRVGLTNLEITGVHVVAPQGWPAVNTFSAQRVVMVPDLRDLTSGKVVIDRVILEGAYISAVRAKVDGGMRILPGVLDLPGIDPQASPTIYRPSHGAVIGKVELQDCTVDLYSSMAAGAKKTRIDSLSGVIENVEVPTLTGETMLELKGLITGAEQRAGIASKGWGDVAKANSPTDPGPRNSGRPSYLPYY